MATCMTFPFLSPTFCFVFQYLSWQCKGFVYLIRAVAEQRSYLNCAVPIKLKCIRKKKKKKKKNELTIARVCGCSIFWPPAPLRDMCPGLSSYETDPPRFLYLKDEYFLMTDWCDIDISLIMKNSKYVTLTSRSMRRWEMGMEQYNFRPTSNIRYNIN